MTTATSELSGAAPETQPADAPEITWRDRLSDWVNPILVREIVQAMHGKVFMVTLAAACSAVVLVALGVLAFDVTDGREVFSFSVMLLMPIVLFIVPLQSFWSMRHEVAGGTAEQLLLTALTPRRIVIGKLSAAVLMYALFLGMFAPLLGMTYLLRGTDVVTITVILVGSMFGTVLANAFAIAMAALGRLKVVGALSMALTVAGLGGLTMAGIAISWDGIREIQRAASSRDFASFLLGFFGMVSVATWLLGAIASASLAHEYENRSTTFRVLCVAASAGAFTWITWVVPSGLADSVLPATSAVVAAVTGPFLIAFACEAEPLSPRVGRYVTPRRRLAAFLAPLLPGGGRGMAFVVAFSVLFLAAGLVLPMLLGQWPEDDEAAMATGAWCYVLIFAGIGRFARARMGAHPNRFWIANLIVWGVIILGMVWSLVVRAAGMRSRWTGLDIPNFGYTLSNLDRSRDYWALVVLGGLALAAVFVSMATMRRGLAEVRQASATRRELEST